MLPMRVKPQQIVEYIQAQTETLYFTPQGRDFFFEQTWNFPTTQCKLDIYVFILIYFNNVETLENVEKPSNLFDNQ